MTVDSQLDHYCARPSTHHFEELAFLPFVEERYRIPLRKNLSTGKKEVIVIPSPYCSPGPDGPKYDQFCRQKLMIHKPFHQLEQAVTPTQQLIPCYSNTVQSLLLYQMIFTEWK